MATALTRKQFLRHSCKSSCGILLGIGLLGSLESCSGFKVIKAESNEGIITIPLAAFAEDNVRLVRAARLDYDIMVTKRSETSYTALVLKCTHQDWNLIANPKGLNCSLHGSAFDLDGNVTQGPAVQPLTQLKTTITNQSLTIS